MENKKDILLTTTTIASTVGLAVSMALHFTPWPHNNNNHTNILDIPYTIEELRRQEEQKTRAVYQWNHKEYPQSVNVNTTNENEPYRNYPLTIDKKREQTYRGQLTNKATAHFTDCEGQIHCINIQLNAYPEYE